MRAAHGQARIPAHRTWRGAGRDAQRQGRAGPFGADESGQGAAGLNRNQELFTAGFAINHTNGVYMARPSAGAAIPFLRGAIARNSAGNV